MKQILNSSQRVYWRRKTHHGKTIVWIGRGGLVRGSLICMDRHLEAHQWVKVNFRAFKNKKERSQLSFEIERTLSCYLIEILGHVGLFVRV